MITAIIIDVNSNYNYKYQIYKSNSIDDTTTTNNSDSFILKETFQLYKLLFSDLFCYL